MLPTDTDIDVYVDMDATDETDARAEGESAGDGDEENRLMACSGGEEWGAGAKDRQQTTFSQPEQSYEAAFNKVRHGTMRCGMKRFSQRCRARVALTA